MRLSQEAAVCREALVRDYVMHWKMNICSERKIEGCSHVFVGKWTFCDRVTGPNWAPSEGLGDLRCSTHGDEIWKSFLIQPRNTAVDLAINTRKKFS
jgi:hypothetical protein